jgi:hypothetical protein
MKQCVKVTKMIKDDEGNVTQEYVGTFKNMSKVVKFLNTNYANVANVCYGKRRWVTINDITYVFAFTDDLYDKDLD